MRNFALFTFYVFLFLAVIFILVGCVLIGISICENTFWDSPPLWFLKANLILMLYGLVSAIFNGIMAGIECP